MNENSEDHDQSFEQLPELDEEESRIKNNNQPKKLFTVSIGIIIVMIGLLVYFGVSYISEPETNLIQNHLRSPTQIQKEKARIESMPPEISISIDSSQQSKHDRTDLRDANLNQVKNIQQIQIQRVEKEIKPQITKTEIKDPQNSQQQKQTLAHPTITAPEIILYKSQAEIKLENQRLKKQTLDKYYSNGLKQYYESIQQQIKIVSISLNKLAKQSSILFLINNIEYKTSLLCIQQIKSISRETDALNSYDCICIFRKQAQISDLQAYLKQKLIQYIVRDEITDSSYNFLTQYIKSNTQWLIYIANNFNFHQQILNSIAKQEENNTYLYVPNSQTPINQISDFSDRKYFDILSNSVLFFPIYFLRIISPLNFAFQDVYNFEELVVYPIIALHQMGKRIKIIKTNQNMRIQQKTNQKGLGLNKTEFALAKLKARESPHLCLVTTPSNLSLNQQKETIQYLQNIRNYINKSQSNTNQSLSLFLTLIYISNQNIEAIIEKVTKLLHQGLQIKIFLEYQKISPPLQAYRAAYAYCPQNSLMFSSRMNTFPLIENIFNNFHKTQMCYNRKNWIMIGNYICKNSQNQQVKAVGALGSFRSKFRAPYISAYYSHFLHAQIYCQETMRQIRLQNMKWQQLEFYQTQASFIIPLVERTANNFSIVADPLYKVLETRTETQKEKIQFRGLSYRNKFEKNITHPVSALQYSQLNNHAFKRNPPQLIPRILHQIWLSNLTQVAPIRKALVDTLINTNPTFEYKLWTWENVTREQFPITYDGILKFQQVEKQKNRNYKALISDLMRIQFLYKYGGIYFDFKIQGKKSLQPFLKYEDFYLLANQQMLVNGLIGSIKGNRHFRTMLEDFFKPQNLHAPQHHIYEMTGGTKLIQAYTKKQLYTQSMNFEPFILSGPRPCVLSRSHQQLQSGQKAFQGMTAFSVKSKYRVFVPCKKDMQKYLELYDILGRTYLPGNEQFH